MKVFSTMPQQMAVNAAMKTEKLTKDLKEFLRPFAEGGKVVTKEVFISSIFSFFFFEKKKLNEKKNKKN